jgi:hypothetical protein
VIENQGTQNNVIELKEIADSEEASNLLKLALSFAKGDGVDKNQKKAVSYYIKAHNLGNRTATYNLAIRYLDGRGIKKNEDKSLTFFESLLCDVDNQLYLDKLSGKSAFLAGILKFSKDTLGKYQDYTFYHAANMSIPIARAISAVFMESEDQLKIAVQELYYKLRTGLYEEAYRTASWSKGTDILTKNYGIHTFLDEKLEQLYQENNWSCATSLRAILTLLYADEINDEVISTVKNMISPISKKDILAAYMQFEPRRQIENKADLELLNRDFKEFSDIFTNRDSHYYAPEFDEFLFIDTYYDIKDQNLTFANKALEFEVKQKDEAKKLLEEKHKELNNLIAMFAHNFLGTLQCIRSNAEYENNPNIHLKTVKMMGGALIAFSILSADDDKLVEQLKQDNVGETSLQQSLANNLALAISQLLGKTNKDKIINLYLQRLSKTKQIKIETTSEELRENKDYRKKWQALQHQWEDEFYALFSEKADLPELQQWITDNFFPIEIIGFDSCNISFKEYGITDSIFLIVFMEIFVNAFKYMDVSKNEPLILMLCEEDKCCKLVCENPSSQETGRGTHKGMDFLKTIAKKLNGDFITASTENSFKTTFAISSELLK